MREDIIVEEGALMNAQHDVAKVTVTNVDGTVEEYVMDKNVHLILGVITVTEVTEEGYSSETDMVVESGAIVTGNFIKSLREETLPSKELMISMLDDLLSRHL